MSPDVMSAQGTCLVDLSKESDSDDLDDIESIRAHWGFLPTGGTVEDFLRQAWGADVPAPTQLADGTSAYVLDDVSDGAYEVALVLVELDDDRILRIEVDQFLGKRTQDEVTTIATSIAQAYTS
ncbi:hypothetical protein [Janibacter anophelis]|uniref:hypothetical protein n=1 Tax=Janibacter anophelis TaxID=319054 RepID=UPI0012EE9FFD|nr:hypothetical protein [Janibacter anophelis]